MVDCGDEAVVKIHLGALHGFMVFPGVKVTEEAAAVTIRFVQEKLEAAA